MAVTNQVSIECYSRDKPSDMKDLWVSNIPRESSEQKVDKYLSTYITYDTTTFTPQLKRGSVALDSELD